MPPTRAGGWEQGEGAEGGGRASGVSGGLQESRARSSPRPDSLVPGLPRPLTSEDPEEVPLALGPAVQSPRGWEQKRPQAPASYVLAWPRRSPLLLPAGPHWPGALEIWGVLGPPSASCPVVVKGLPRSCLRLHLEAPGLSLLVSLCVQEAVTEACKGGSPLLSPDGTRVPLVSLLLHGLGQVTAPLWVPDPPPWTKRRGWAGSEVKTGLWPCTHTHTHTRVIDTHHPPSHAPDRNRCRHLTGHGGPHHPQLPRSPSSSI